MFVFPILLCVYSVDGHPAYLSSFFILSICLISIFNYKFCRACQTSTIIALFRVNSRARGIVIIGNGESDLTVGIAVHVVYVVPFASYQRLVCSTHARR